MSVLLRDTSSAVIAAPRRMIPRVTGALARAALGRSADLTRRNLFNPDVPFGVAGAPTYSTAPDFAGLKGQSSYLDTGIAEQDSMTLFAVVRSTDLFSAPATQPGIVGNLGLVAGGGGCGIYVAGTTGAPAAAVRMAAAVVDSATTALINAGFTIANFSGWNLLVGVVEAGVGCRLYNRTTGQVATGAADARPRAKNAAVPMRIGSMGGVTAGNCDVAMADIYPGALTVTQIDQVVSDIRLVLAARGLAI